MLQTVVADQHVDSRWVRGEQGAGSGRAVRPSQTGAPLPAGDQQRLVTDLGGAAARGDRLQTTAAAVAAADDPGLPAACEHVDQGDDAGRLAAAATAEVADHHERRTQPGADGGQAAAGRQQTPPQRQDQTVEP
jgi:hypothetical protein